MSKLVLCYGLFLFYLCCVSVVIHGSKNGLGFLLVIFVTNEGRNPRWSRWLVPKGKLSNIIPGLGRTSNIPTKGKNELLGETL